MSLAPCPSLRFALSRWSNALTLPASPRRRALPLPCALVCRLGSTRRPRRYYANTSHVKEWPPEVREYNRSFTKALESIKKRHDPTVTTVAQGVLEWKRSQNARNINLDVQHWLDRFYMSRIGIRFLIGQRTSLPSQARGGESVHERTHTYNQLVQTSP